MKICCYVTDDGHNDKRATGKKKCVIKGEINFEDYKHTWKIKEQS